MPYFKPCWSCGSKAACYEDCECAKCLDPEDYQEWKENNPEEYSDWIESQKEHDEEDDYD